MSTNHILEELVKFVTQKLPGAAISGATDLQQDVPFDSLDRMELLVMIEKAYGVTVSPDDHVEHHLEILQHLAAFIAERQTVGRA